MILYSLLLLVLSQLSPAKATVSISSEEMPNVLDEYDNAEYEECTGLLSQCQSEWECCIGLECRWKGMIKEYRCERVYPWPFGRWIPPTFRKPPPPTHVPPPPRWLSIKDFIPYFR